MHIVVIVHVHMCVRARETALLTCIVNINIILSEPFVCLRFFQFPYLFPNSFELGKSVLCSCPPDECFTSPGKYQDNVITAPQTAPGATLCWAPDLGCWPTSVPHAVRRWPVTQEHNNKMITNNTSYSEACCCCCCSKKCHTTHCWVAVGSIKQRKWLTIALLSV